MSDATENIQQDSGMSPDAHLQALNGAVAEMTGAHKREADVFVGAFAAALAPISHAAATFFGVIAAMGGGKPKSAMDHESNQSRKKPISLLHGLARGRNSRGDEILARAGIASASLTNFPIRGAKIAGPAARKLSDATKKLNEKMREIAATLHMREGANRYDNNSKRLHNEAGSELAREVAHNTHVRQKIRPPAGPSPV